MFDAVAGSPRPHIELPPPDLMPVISGTKVSMVDTLPSTPKPVAPADGAEPVAWDLALLSEDRRTVFVSLAAREVQQGPCSLQALESRTKVVLELLCANYGELFECPIDCARLPIAAARLLVPLGKRPIYDAAAERPRLIDFYTPPPKAQHVETVNTVPRTKGGGPQQGPQRLDGEGNLLPAGYKG